MAISTKRVADPVYEMLKGVDEATVEWLKTGYPELHKAFRKESEAINEISNSAVERSRGILRRYALLYASKPLFDSLMEERQREEKHFLEEREKAKNDTSKLAKAGLEYENSEKERTRRFDDLIEEQRGLEIKYRNQGPKEVQQSLIKEILSFLKEKTFSIGARGRVEIIAGLLSYLNGNARREYADINGFIDSVMLEVLANEEASDVRFDAAINFFSAPDDVRHIPPLYQAWPELRSRQADLHKPSAMS